MGQHPDRLVHGANDVAGHTGSMISATEPQRKASTGVPQAMASIIDNPNGSGQSTGNSKALAPPRRGYLMLAKDYRPGLPVFFP